jgi:pimeloyl-ACP methyl ester carboxylesterase
MQRFLSLIGVAAFAATSASAQTRPGVAAVDSGRIAVPGSSLFYEAAGSGPTVILLHSGNLDRRIWNDQFLALAETFRVIRFDARGLGRSGPIAGPFSRLADLEAVVGHFGLRRVMLVGSSLGGVTAVDFALAHPGQVVSLALIGTGLSGWRWAPEDLNVPWRVAARAAAARGDTVGIARAWLRSDLFAAAAEHPAIAARLDSMLADNVGIWKSLLLHGDQEIEPRSAVDRLNAIKVPTLVVIGARDTPELRVIADTIATTVPRATLIQLPEVGHLPSVEQPEELLGLLVRFLRKSIQPGSGPGDRLTQH